MPHPPNPSDRTAGNEPRHPGFLYDPAQEQALARLRRIHDAVLSTSRAPARPGLLGTLFGRARRAAPVPGLYLWGEVGRGKTWLVDHFFEALPIEDKTRLHFHRFMQRVHAELKSLKGQPNPMRTVTARLAESRLICLDELFVSDITDAVLMHHLLDGLFGNGVTLIATSNIPPDDLYRNGLQRDLFLPAIGLIKRHMEVFHLDGGVDYRMRALERAEIYHHPLDEGATRALTSAFESIAPEPGREGGSIEIEGRPIDVQRVADGVVWFRFADLCDGPRSQLDYVEIARQFHSVLLSDVPVMDERLESPARRFMALVDEFYDRNVKLIVAAAAAPEALYRGSHLNFEFRRVVSRLHEMQSHAYLERPHLP